MTKAQTILAQEQERLLTQERDKLREALSDLLDGEEWWDIQYNTGFPEERCKEFLRLVGREPRDPVRLERKK